MDWCSVNTLKALPSGRSSVKTCWQMQWSPLYNTAQVEAPLIGGNCAVYHSWINTVKTLPESTHLRGEFCPNLFTNKVNPSLEVEAQYKCIETISGSTPTRGEIMQYPLDTYSKNSFWKHSFQMKILQYPVDKYSGALSERNSARHF